MADDENKSADTSKNISALEDTHRLLLEALRHREQEIIQYLAILVPAMAAFGWLVNSATNNDPLFIGGTIGVLLLLLLGAMYSLALGYNFRYIILQLAKFEAHMGISDSMLEAWPRTRQDFLDNYILCRIPWCTPPEIIKVFWRIFLAVILAITVTACRTNCSATALILIVAFGAGSMLISGFILPISFGYKLHKLAKEEPESWTAISPDKKPESDAPRKLKQDNCKILCSLFRALARLFFGKKVDI